MNLTRNKTTELDAKAAKAAREARTARAVSAVKAAKAANAIRAAQAAQAAQGAAASAQSAAQAAAMRASGAASSAGDAAQTYARGMGTGVKHGIYNYRAWAAPQLNHAADYYSNTVAPWVTGALRNTASQVHPGDFPSNGNGNGKAAKSAKMSQAAKMSKAAKSARMAKSANKAAKAGKMAKMSNGGYSSGKSLKSRILTWSLLGIAACAAAGAAAALARYRYQESIAASTEPADETYVVTEQERRTATFYPSPTDPVEDGDMPPTDRVRTTGW